MLVDHVKFYVADIKAAANWLVDGYGFAITADGDPAGGTARLLGLGANDVRLVLAQPVSAADPGRTYLDRHGDGVCDIALRVPDAAAAFDEAVRRGARPVSAPVRRRGLVTATIMGFGDLTHTFVQRAGDAGSRALPGLRPVPGKPAGWNDGLSGIDHFAGCLEAGQLDPTVEFYERVLDFKMIYTERIAVGSQGMNSKVVQSRSGAVTFTLLEPDLSRARGQIDDFLFNHRGSGIQHVALITDDIVRTVGSVRARGIDFLRSPASYYRLIADRLRLSRHSVDRLRDLSILADSDHHGQLYQIFTKSVHPRQTFFFEIIERAGARTFGSSNIKALYEAVEAERLASHAAAPSDIAA
jgi:4-hydroxymandelate synthase